MGSAPSTGQQIPAQDGLQPILHYIGDGWVGLSRSLTECKTVSDPKTEKSVLYFPADMAVPAAEQQLQQECGVRIEHLPSVLHRLGEADMKQIVGHGLLYLPNSYVVPGGFFNEMYGWDSYFIILGLLRDKRLDLARGMVENFFFEIEHYGAVLNANRGYFLTRSQPPFLTSMIMAVHETEKAAGRDDRAWLSKAYEYAVRDHDLWVREPHLAGDTGLSRYFDFGQGPVPEITESKDSYYYDVAQQLARHPQLMNDFMTPEAASSTPAGWPRFALYLCPQGSSAGGSCPALETIAFTSDYYKGDRSMRESGFDISFRFGPFSGATHHYAPVCLNSLLFKTEQDLATISHMLSREEESVRWKQRADARRAAINKYLWDAKAGMFFDFDFENGTRSSYVYASTFYPLWAGLASEQQARAVAANLKQLERPGGLAMSNRVTGVQWDLPYGWAPVQLLAVEGLRRYGFHDQANSLAYKFLSTVLENFRRDGTIREKYNVVTRSSEAKVTAGYQANVIGFGWTNGVFLELLHGLPKQWSERLERPATSAADAR
jgi:alpha,alpha-trehalase